MAINAKRIALVALVAMLVGYYVIVSTVHLPTAVTIGAAIVAVELADTHEERVQGLSGRQGLPWGQGLLFDFKERGSWGIWMKDMRFAIDIVWANEGRVVTVRHEVSPLTYPQSFYPAEPVRYVLELPAGFAAAHGIAEGDNFTVR